MNFGKKRQCDIRNVKYFNGKCGGFRAILILTKGNSNGLSRSSSGNQSYESHHLINTQHDKLDGNYTQSITTIAEMPQTSHSLGNHHWHLLQLIAECVVQQTDVTRQNAIATHSFENHPQAKITVVEMPQTSHSLGNYHWQKACLWFFRASWNKLNLFDRICHCNKLTWFDRKCPCKELNWTESKSFAFFFRATAWNWKIIHCKMRQSECVHS